MQIGSGYGVKAFCRNVQGGEDDTGQDGLA